MDQLVAPRLPSSDEDQVLLTVADGGYLVAAGDGVVRECGADLAERVGVSAADAIGRPLIGLLQPQVHDAARSALPQALAGAGGEFDLLLADGASGLRVRVVPVPLALGWEFTALLGAIGARDPETWSAATLRAEHGQAIDSVHAAAGPMRPDTEHDPAARLAGILVIVRPVDGGRLDRAEVARRRADRLAEERAAPATAGEAASVETARHHAGEDEQVTLDETVEQVRAVRRRLDLAQQSAAAAIAARDEVTRERDDLHAQLDEERLARETAETAAQAALDELAGLTQQDAETAGRLVADLDRAKAEIDGAHARLERVTTELEGVRAELEDMRAELESTRAERDEAVQRASAHAAEAGRARTVATAIRS
ncbi:MAG: hypothetical protein JWO02_3222, partial [Solirubrobacterales bacterium]|nr:hypothetical protein [Solirubrobacterales bacterium]